LGTDTTVSFQYSANGSSQTHTLRFHKVRAYRHYAEVHCTAEVIETSYDKLVTVEDSSWAAEIRQQTSSQWRNYWKLRHFMIYFDSNGSYELLAESWTLDPATVTVLQLGV
jgi:hypothetical protein